MCVSLVGAASAQTEPGRAVRPLAPARPGLQDLAALDLLLAAVLVRQAGATDRGPGGGAELQAAVVAVAGVDRPVATGLALRQAVPHGVAAGHVDGRS